MILPIVDHYVGIPVNIKSHDSPFRLYGTWGRATYSVQIDIESPHTTTAVIAVGGAVQSYPVHIKFYTEDRQFLLRQLKHNPTSFLVIFQLKGKKQKVFLFSNILKKLPERPRLEKKVKVVRLHLDQSILMNKSQEESIEYISQLIKTVSISSFSEEKSAISALAMLSQMNKIDLGPESHVIEKIKAIQTILETSKNTLKQKLDDVKKNDRISDESKTELSKAFEMFAKHIHGLFLDDNSLNNCAKLFVEAATTQKMI